MENKVLNENFGNSGKELKKLKILMLEDLESDAGLVEWTLKKAAIDFESRRVDTEGEFIDGITKFCPDVILSDHGLPQFNSVEAYKICKRYNLDIPFILVTGTVSEEFAVSCLKEGIDDYILKSNLTRLPVAIQSAIKQRRLEQQKVKADLELKEQNDHLLKINRELDNFAYNVSHNLKAPLVSVLGLINLIYIENEKQKGKFTELIDLMKESIDKLNKTLTSIIDHSRNSRTELKTDSVEIKPLIDKSLMDLNFSPNQENIAKKIEVDQSVSFYCDSYRLDVIINNLISNALKYYDPQKHDPYIAITAKVSVSKAVITFEDNGIGISEDQLPYVFDMFTRGTEHSDGSGLGLYIVKEMVKRLNGDISIKSADGKGTFVELVIPNSKDHGAFEENG